jgi:YD repeat-containing protein
MSISNGAVAGYTLGNGITHKTTQNLRGLPGVWRDAGVVQDAYAYDANGNTLSITDQQEGISSRTMGYDALDRLTAANGPWGAGSFGYDALDNIRTSTIGSRSLVHAYDATGWSASPAARTSASATTPTATSRSAARRPSVLTSATA